MPFLFFSPPKARLLIVKMCQMLNKIHFNGAVMKSKFNVNFLQTTLKGRGLRTFLIAMSNFFFEKNM